MAKTIKEERLRWVLPIYRKEVRLVDAAKLCTYSKRTLERWLASYRKRGEAGLIPKSTRPKSSPKEMPIRIKERVIELRKETSQCALKIKWSLEDEGINLSTRVVGKYIKTEGLTRKYKTKRLKYRYIKVPLSIGELVEIDAKYVPSRIKGKRYYQLTAIDCSSRWRYLAVYDDLGTHSVLKFLEELLKVFPGRIRSIKTDNASCFTNRYVGYEKSTDPLNPKLHPLDKLCERYNIIHYLIDPGKPAQNGKVERSHRSDQESFYDKVSFKTERELKYKLKLWNMYYNDLRHCSLGGKTPNEMIELLV